MRIPWTLYRVQVSPGRRWAGLLVQTVAGESQRAYLWPDNNRVPPRAWGQPWRAVSRRRLRIAEQRG